MTAPTEAGAGVAKRAQWEMLTTAEQVMAAHEAGRGVWNRPGKGRQWLQVGCRGIDNIRAFILAGWEYRAITFATGAQP